MAIWFLKYIIAIIAKITLCTWKMSQKNMNWWWYFGAFGWLSYWWCSCGHVRKGWSQPGCRGRRWWGKCSHTCRKTGRWFQWCYTISLCHRPSLWKSCSTPPVALHPTPLSSCLLWAPPPRCSQVDMGLPERERFISNKSDITCLRPFRKYVYICFLAEMRRSFEK